jgi:hypothetical protein
VRKFTVGAMAILLAVSALPPASVGQNLSWQQSFENQVRRLQQALEQAGQPLSAADRAALQAQPTPASVEAILDR